MRNGAFMLSLEFNCGLSIEMLTRNEHGHVARELLPRMYEPGDVDGGIQKQQQRKVYVPLTFSLMFDSKH